MQLVLLVVDAFLQTSRLREGVFSNGQGVLQVGLGSTSAESGGILRAIFSRSLSTSVQDNRRLIDVFPPGGLDGGKLRLSNVGDHIRVVVIVYGDVAA